MSEQGVGQFKGQFVHIELDTHPGENKEYKVEEAANGFIVLREKGKSSPALVKDEQVLSFIEPDPKPVPPLKARRQSPVDPSNVKRHLVDNHGYSVGQINAITIEEAVVLHDGIDHEGLDLSHFHALSKREQAIAEGGPSSDADESQSEDGEEDNPF